jgi:hypothetical protein
MHESRLRLIFFAALVLIAVVFFCVFRNREPSYGGKSLSYWVDHFIEPQPRNAGAGVVWAENPEAGDAIRHIGTNAIPYLLKLMSYRSKPPFWRTTWYEMLATVFGKPRDHTEEDYRRDSRRDNAAKACGVFGPDALPILRQAWTNSPALYATFDLLQAMWQIQAKARLTEQEQHTR